MRISLGLLPFGHSGPPRRLSYGYLVHHFEPAAPMLAILILGAIPFIIVSVATVIATACGFDSLALFEPITRAFCGGRKLCFDPPIRRLRRSHGYGTVSGNWRHGVRRCCLPALVDRPADRNTVAECSRQPTGVHGGCDVANCWCLNAHQIGVHGDRNPSRIPGAARIFRK